MEILNPVQGKKELPVKSLKLIALALAGFVHCPNRCVDKPYNSHLHSTSLKRSKHSFINDGGSFRSFPIILLIS